MRISDIIAEYIFDVLEKSNGSAEIRRNELALEFGCVPSQINYVITSRFTPEQGYIVESRRGGGGYIRIKRIKAERTPALMHIVNSIGDQLSFSEGLAMISNLRSRGILDETLEGLIKIALSDRSYEKIPPSLRDLLRASIFKNMLLALI